MLSVSSSTEDLLNSFPMFGHPGISALEYAGSVEASLSKRNTSETLESLKRKSTTSTQDENTTPPTTASTEPSEPNSSPQLHVVENFGCQQRRKGAFLNHTPRYYEMRSSSTMDMHRPTTASPENYSRPRTARQSGASSWASETRDGDNPSRQFCPIEKQPTINRGSPIELDATEKHPISPLEVYKSTTTTGDQLPLSNRHEHNDISQLHSIPSGGDYDKERTVRSGNKSIRKLQEKKRQRRQTPFRLAGPKLTVSSRHAPLEPWVAKHRREGTNATTNDLILQSETGPVKEIGTFGVIQRYFDSQTGGPVASPKVLCGACSPTSQTLFLSTPSTPYPHESFQEPVAIFPIDNLTLPDEEPPTLPDRSPKRVTNPGFPLKHKPMLSSESDFAFAADGQYSPYEDNDGVLHIPKKRNQERVEKGQPAPAGLSKVGRMAPPILGHDALTASSHLGLNDLSYYLKHTGPSSDSSPTIKREKVNGLKIFKVKRRKTLAARVGSVEGSPQKTRRPTPVPTCAKEVTTSSGTKHLKIIIPTELQSANHAPSLSTSSQTRSKRRSRHVSITFTEEMLNPLASLRIERMLSNIGAPPERSFSEPIITQTRTSKKTLRSSKPIPVDNHPLALSREESVRARKLRDLQRVKRKPLPIDTRVAQHTDASVGSLSTPSGTPEPALSHSSPSTTLHEPEGRNACDLEEEGSAEKMARIQDRVMMLQRQNTELTEALAKIVGLELEGDLRSEDVLKAFRQRRLLIKS